MPVHNLGYRGWTEQRMPKRLRPWVLARAGISLVWQRKLLRFLLIFAWLPIFFPALGIFAFEFASTDADWSRLVIGLLSSPMIDQRDLALEMMQDPEGARHQVWSALILSFFRYPQAVAMVMLVGLIAPMMISYDLRSKAYLMYFSRPLTPSEYILGKSAVIWFFLAMISTLPALGLYVLGVLLSPDLSVVLETWDIPLRILAASAVLLVPTTAVALCYSSMSTESRYTTFGWFATWIMGSVAYRTLTFAGGPDDFDRPPRPPRGPRFERGFEQGDQFGGPPDFPGGPPSNPEFEAWISSIDVDKWRAVSPYDTLGKVQAWIFDLDNTPASVTPYLVLLCGVTVVCLWWVRRRIVKRLSV